MSGPCSRPLERKELDQFPRLRHGRIARLGEGVCGGAKQPIRMRAVVCKRHDNSLSRPVAARIIEDFPTADVERRLVHDPMKLAS